MKRKIRETALNNRQSKTAEEANGKNLKITGRLVEHPLFKKANVILFYVSVRGEVDTVEAIRQSLAIWKKRVVVPKVTKDKRLELFEIKSLSELKPGAFGIFEPDVSPGREVLAEELDLAIIPGIAFDERGHRVGYGHGYYDRLLKRIFAPTIGLAYEDQLVTAIPEESHDVPVQIVITEQRTIECKK